MRAARKHSFYATRLGTNGGIIPANENKRRMEVTKRTNKEERFPRARTKNSKKDCQDTIEDTQREHTGRQEDTGKQTYTDTHEKKHAEIHAVRRLADIDKHIQRQANRWADRHTEKLRHKQTYEANTGRETMTRPRNKAKYEPSVSMWKYNHLPQSIRFPLTNPLHITSDPFTLYSCRSRTLTRLQSPSPSLLKATQHPLPSLSQYPSRHKH